MLNNEESNKRSTRGFASMDKSRQKEIASKGGMAAHQKGTAHEFSPAEASRAARKGHERGTAHEFTSEEARIAGRKGGQARASQWSNHGGNGAAGRQKNPRDDSGNVSAAAPDSFAMNSKSAQPTETPRVPANAITEN